MIAKERIFFYYVPLALGSIPLRNLCQITCGSQKYKVSYRISEEVNLLEMRVTNPKILFDKGKAKTRNEALDRQPGTIRNFERKEFLRLVNFLRAVLFRVSGGDKRGARSSEGSCEMRPNVPGIAFGLERGRWRHYFESPERTFRASSRMLRGLASVAFEWFQTLCHVTLTPLKSLWLFRVPPILSRHSWIVNLWNESWSTWTANWTYNIWFARALHSFIWKTHSNTMIRDTIFDSLDFNPDENPLERIFFFFFFSPWKSIFALTQ